MKTLYVTDRAAVGDARLEKVLEALRGAPGLLVQLREKTGSDRDLLAMARSARVALGPLVPLFVNRRLDVALAAEADGVHLPADGLPLTRVRSASPRGFRVGVSTHSPIEAARAIEEGADVVVIGPIFDTPSKASFGPPLGTPALAGLPELASHGADVFAIGGIDEPRLEELAPFADRISGIAAVRLIQDSGDPRALVERIAAA
ncbi:MAG TPA: thiamine phosphate synthase [Thermoanaerobaculia bacterium]|nr:thiamine phosphate synthase [Thermoanaerobaculia bacterium]